MQSCSEGVQACRIRCATIGRRNPSAVRLAEHAPDPPAAGDSSPPKGAAKRASFKPAGKRGECFFVPLRSLCLKRRPASYVERQRQGQALERKCWSARHEPEARALTLSRPRDRRSWETRRHLARNAGTLMSNSHAVGPARAAARGATRLRDVAVVQDAPGKGRSASPDNLTRAVRR